MGKWVKGQSGNPKGRVAGVEILRQMLDPHRSDLITKAVELAKAGDVAALRLCFVRIAPPPRSEAAPVHIDGLAEAATMSDKARAIIAACGNGEISPDTASMLLGAIANASRIIEADELADRITLLEERSVNQ